eukprot:CAMPEP_0206452338 /NCGR_PEP_ID=MMETSP0324_2-20121206/19889_1 /ASSEMBLY_ACC=CAM_ASM_000836 /TAXON_ID=2866 /ORGANISM="Crypthecodinium cohnii, Strain Seligo" /LENGTH=104 /DNA_ID=CAMNT_0053922415 /DNA_START=199 /DNA_END=513 /DNA_ORIENTATION=-
MPPKAPLQKGVVISGTTYTLEQIETGKVEIAEGTYIVMAQKERKGEVLEALEKEFQYKPESTLSMMPMFAGTLNKEKIVFLLKHEAVELIEADGVATLCTPAAA